MTLYFAILGWLSVLGVAYSRWQFVRVNAQQARLIAALKASHAELQAERKRVVDTCTTLLECSTAAVNIANAEIQSLKAQLIDAKAHAVTVVPFALQTSGRVH